MKTTGPGVGLVIAALSLLVLPTRSLAMGDHSSSDRIERGRPRAQGPVSAPEIAPGRLSDALAIVGGGLLILSERRRRRRATVPHEKGTSLAEAMEETAPT